MPLITRFRASAQMVSGRVNLTRLGDSAMVRKGFVKMMVNIVDNAISGRVYHVSRLVGVSTSC